MTIGLNRVFVAVLSLAAVLALIAGCAGPPPAQPGSTLHWAACPDGPALQCATLTVPLDYGAPAGLQVRLPLVRIPATDPAHRLGSVVLHRGGPGYSGVEYVHQLQSGQQPGPFDAATSARYDVIGFDQRGIGGSVPAVRCFASEDESRLFAAGVPAFPATDDERRARAAKDAEYAKRCRDLSGALLDHLTSADAARDLDRLRAAIGEPRLNLVGQSYGSYLAAVYASMFPDQVGRFVLDSVLDPVRQTTGAPGTVPSERTGSDVSSQATLAEFFRVCAEAGPRCPFGDGHPADAFDALIKRLRTAPVRLTAPDGRRLPVTDQLIFSVAGALLYQPGVGWEPLASTLAQTIPVVTDPSGKLAAGYASAMLATLDAGVGGVSYGETSPGFYAVHCVDADTPHTPEGWAVATQRRQPVAPGFAALRAYEDSVCAFWKADKSDRFTGPWNLPTDRPMLILNDRFDPATPLESATRLHQTLPNSRLLINDGWGHITTQQSHCAVKAISTFLLDGQLPREGTTCQPDRTPFTPN